MSKHLLPERVIRAARALAKTNNPIFADFLILKFHGISTTSPVTLTNTSTIPGIELLMAVRRANHEAAVPEHPYFNPFAKSDGWRIEAYARSGPQSNIDRGNLSRIIIKSSGLPASATLRTDYIKIMAPGLLSRRTRNAPRIPLRELGIWLARSKAFADEDDPEILDDLVLQTFNIVTSERIEFFDESVDAGDLFAPGSPNVDELADYIVNSFPPVPQATVRTGDESESTAAQEEAAIELPSDLLERIRGELVVPDVTIRQLITVIRMGKNVILTGPPGTGKSTLAFRLARVAAEDAAKAPQDRQFDLPNCSGYLPTTATADWSTFDTIGGYVPNASGSSLEFREGMFLQAVRSNRWLIIDELNRADVDKAFGQLFTVLSGQEVDLPYRSNESGESNLSIRRDNSSLSRFESKDGEYVIGSDWRIVATMNTFDRSHLFQLSAAFVRRFAVVNVPVPSITELEGWLQAKNLDNWVLERVRRLLVLLEHERPLGPALIGDFVDYLLRRLPVIPGIEAAFVYQGANKLDADSVENGPLDEQIGKSNDSIKGAQPEDPFLEAVTAFILPQMDGLDAGALGRLKIGFRQVVAGTSSAELDRQFRDLFRI